MKDEYRRLRDYPGYRIYPNGKIYSDLSNKFIRWHHDTSGYRSVKLYNGSKATSWEVKVHVLVALLYIPNPYNYPEINHKDGKKDNNKVDNLEWCSRSYNVRYDLTRRQESGQKHSPLTEEHVRLVPILLKYGLSIKLISKLYKVGHITIRNIIKGKTWRNLKLIFEDPIPFNRGIIEIPNYLYNQLKSLNVDNTVLSSRIIPTNSVTHR